MDLPCCLVSEAADVVEGLRGILEVVAAVVEAYTLPEEDNLLRIAFAAHLVVVEGLHVAEAVAVEAFPEEGIPEGVFALAARAGSTTDSDIAEVGPHFVPVVDKEVLF